MIRKGCKETFDRAPMSLLSLSLAGQNNGDQTSPPSSLPLPHFRSISEKSDCERDQPTAEPPLKLDIERIPNSAPLGSHIPPCINRTTFSYSERKREFGASPLSACSYNTMSKEYDMDTWRMYNLIQTARSRKPDEFIQPDFENENDDDNEGETHEVAGHVHSIQPESSLELGYGEEMFDLEL